MRSYKFMAWVVGVAALMGLSCPIAALGSCLCSRGGPESLLDCYSNAVANRDSSEFAALIAPDYSCPDPLNLDRPDFGREETIAQLARAFRSSEVTGVTIEFGSPGAVEEGEEAGTWVLRDVPATVRIEGTDNHGRPGPFIIESVTSYWVRAVNEPEPHYLLYREEQHAPAGK